MPDDPDPPRKFYELKPREFERVNEVAPRAPEEKLPTATSGQPTSESGRIDVRELFKQASLGGPALSREEKPVAENDVHDILRENHERATAAGLNEVKPLPRRRSRRRRDYWVLMIGVNSLVAIIYLIELLVGFQVQCLAAKMPQEFGNLVFYALHTPSIYAMPLLGMFTLSAAITWLMFGMMDDY